MPAARAVGSGCSSGIESRTLRRLRCYEPGYYEDDQCCAGLVGTVYLQGALRRL